MPLYQCTQCQRTFADTCITNVSDLGSVRNGERPPIAGKQKWWDTGARKQYAIFLVEPPPDPNGKHTCSISDLVYFDSLDDFRRANPVTPKSSSLSASAQQGVTMPVATPVATTPVYQPPVWQFPASMPAYNDLRTYATGTCQLCEKANCHAIGESARTRFMALQIHQHMRNVRDRKASLALMIGVAIEEGTKTIAVAFSSNAFGADIELHGCTVSGWTLKLYGKEGVSLDTCRGGRDISAHKGLAKTRVNEGVRDTSSCAASKLVKKYIKDSDLSKWSMTELTYGKIAGDNYVDGDAAPSCGGCEAFLPTLMCSKKRL